MSKEIEDRQRDWPQGEALERQLVYWREQLLGVAAALDLPTDHPRPAVPSFRVARVPFSLGPELRSALMDLGRRQDATLDMVLLAGFQLLLSRWSGQKDVVVGSPVAGRTQRQTEGLIGCFANTLLLRTDFLDDPSFLDLVGRVRETALRAYAHQDVPFEKLVAELQPQRDLSRQPLFQVMFSLQNAPQEKLGRPALKLQPMECPPSIDKFDLFLQLIEKEEGLSGSVDYAIDLFETDTIERMIEHFKILLGGVIANPDCRTSQISLLSDAERHRLLVEWNDTITGYPHDRCAHDLIAEQAARTPEAVAVAFQEQQLSYVELDRRSNQLARHLQTLGVGPEIVVGLCVEQSLEMVIGLLGILKAGGAYLPLDPNYPHDRLSYMLRDARARVLVTGAVLGSKLPEHDAKLVLLDADRPVIARQLATPPRIDIHPDHLAYVIYTSGSTGRPKGVAGRHVSVTNRVAAQQQIAAYSDVDLCCQKGSIAFVDSLFEILAPLVWGRTLAIASRAAGTNVQELVSEFEKQQITRLVTVPSLAAAMARMPQATRNMSRVVGWTLSGEAIGADLLKQLSHAFPACRFVNLYGSTEVAADATTYVVQGSEDPVPIGRPIANMQAYILDRDIEPVPIGVPGELCIGGLGLARGYLGQPGLTAEKFVPSPFGDGERLYRTGDLARWRTDGNLEYLGRIDHQVKIRGFRIELGEIAAALLEHAQVQQAVVITRGHEPDEKRLVAYAVLADDAAGVGSRELRAHLRKSLPEHMVPATYVMLDALPLTPSGKVDRQALPAPEGLLEAARYVAPRMPAEEALAAIWCKILQLDRVSIEDNFFDIGGHSLLAMRVLASLRNLFSVELTLRDFLEGPTIRELAKKIDGNVSAVKPFGIPPLISQPRFDPPGLSYAQEQLWLAEKIAEPGCACNEAFGIRLQGILDVESLERAIGEIIRRHEILRTCIQQVDGKIVQSIGLAGRFRLRSIDLSDGETDGPSELLLPKMLDVASDKFDLERGPLFRASLFRLRRDEHVLFMTAHHLVWDGWSSDVLKRELSVLYEAFSRGAPSPLPALAVQYADYSIWQRGWLQGEALERQLAYWREQLLGVPAALDLPTDHPRPAVASFRVARVPFSLGPELRSALMDLGRRQDATLDMVLLAAFQLLLSRWSGQKDVVVGSPVAGRTQRQTEGLIGCFANTLLLRTDFLDDPSFLDLVGRVRDTALGAYAHQDVPFEKLVAELQPQRDLSRQPLFQVMFALQNVPQEKLELPALKLQPMECPPRIAKFDLFLQMIEKEEGLAGRVDYATDLFERDTIERMIERFKILLGGVIANPDCRTSQILL